METNENTQPLQHGGKRAGAGRKAVRIDLVELEKLSAMQSTDEEIAAFFNVKVRTIERRRKQPAFAAAMERGRAKGRISVRRTLHAQAAEGNVAAAIFLAKNLLGYRDVRRNELSGPDGSPIPIDGGLDYSRLSREEFEQFAALIDKAKKPQEG
ncbi:MAG: hypothetical protein WCB12_10005 [Bryobacteraceae bacterium]